LYHHETDKANKNVCLNETYSRVSVRKCFSDMFPTTNGLNHVAALSPFLFNFVLYYTIRRVQVNQDGSELNCKLQVLVYDDVFLIHWCVSESAILQHCFFWFGNTGADAAIAILLPTLKGFSCNGVVDWNTKCFCYENVLQTR
jgi:hypothetical protein